MKEKRFDRRTKKRAKQALQYIQKIEKLERHIAELQGDTAWLPNQERNLETTETIVISGDRKCYPIKKEEPEKHVNNKTGHDREEKSVNTVRPDGPCQEGMKPGATKRKENVKKTRCETPIIGESRLTKVQIKTVTNQRQRNKIIKRCHFCRKRGHIKKYCPIKRKCWNWMQDNST